VSVGFREGDPNEIQNALFGVATVLAALAQFAGHTSWICQALISASDRNPPGRINTGLACFDYRADDFDIGGQNTWLAQASIDSSARHNDCEDQGGDHDFEVSIAVTGQH
jgi:hypothetical protein